MLVKKTVIMSLLLFIVIIFGECQRKAKVVLLSVENNLDVERLNETIRLNISELKPGMNPEKLEVIDQDIDEVIISQLLDLDENGEYEQIIFQSNFLANEEKTFIVREKITSDQQEVESKVHAKFVPTRKDDIAWENDRIAFRMYGPALQATGEISSGVDVWVKKVRDLIIEKWYQPDFDYHTDQGEGLDCYKVGPSRGCGGIAVWEDSKLIASNNFVTWKILANGPIRTVIELTYAPWEIKQGKVSEVKRITLDAGQNFNCFESTFSLEGEGDSLTCAIGIVKREEAGFYNANPEEGWLSYWEPTDKQNGTIGCAIVVAPKDMLYFVTTSDHHLVVSKTALETPVVYYAGAGWDKSQDFSSKEDWVEYVKDFALRKSSPLIVTFLE